MSIDIDTLKGLWETIERKLISNNEPYKTLNAIYEIHLTDVDDGICQLVFDDGSVVIHYSNVEKPDCTLKMKKKYFKRLLLGNLNSTTAFMTGKLRVTGNINFALKLENMLKRYDFSS